MHRNWYPNPFLHRAKVYTPGFAPRSVPVLDIQGYNCVDMYGPLTYGGTNVIEKGHTDMVGGKCVRLGTHIGSCPIRCPPVPIRIIFMPT